MKNNMKFLTVGTDEICRSKFRPVGNRTDSIKPIGGLWLTKYYEGYNRYNDWVEFLISHPSIFYAKSVNDDALVQPCSLVTLKDSSNIFSLINGVSYEYLISNYSNFDDYISYESLSHDFDGIYIDLLGLQCTMDGIIPIRMADEYSVSTLILFNSDCIDYYQSGKVIIDYDPSSIYDIDVSDYEIKVDNVRKRVK